MTPVERSLMATTAALLAQGRLLDGLSRPLTLFALGSLLVAPLLAMPLSWSLLMLLVAIGGVGLVQAYFAFRVAFDAALFQALSAGDALNGLPGLDGALAALRLMPERKAGRLAEARARGAMRLLLFQASLIVLQVVLIVGGGLMWAV